MKKVLLIVGIVLVAGIALVFGVASYAKAKLRPLAEKVLADCRDGKAEEVYAAAAPSFRHDVTLTDFRDYVDSRSKALGAFRRVSDATGGGIAASTASGTIGTVNLRLEYEKGPATSEVKFQKDGDDWRLISLRIDLDASTAKPTETSVLEARGRELMAFYDAQSFDALYSTFSKPLRDALKKETYDAQMKELFAKAGKTTNLAARSDELARAGLTPEQHKVIFDVVFENGPGEAMFGWQWADARWLLTSFDIHTGTRPQDPPK